MLTENRQGKTVVLRQPGVIKIAHALSYSAWVGVVALRNPHHIGRVGTYGEMCANAGFVSFHFVDVTDARPAVAPWRGSDARFSTNPVCIAMPGAEPARPIILDIACRSTDETWRELVTAARGINVLIETPQSLVNDAARRYAFLAEQWLCSAENGGLP